MLPYDLMLVVLIVLGADYVVCKCIDWVKCRGQKQTPAPTYPRPRPSTPPPHTRY